MKHPHITRALVLIPAILAPFAQTQADQPGFNLKDGANVQHTTVIVTNGSLKSSDLIGMKVLTAEDKNLGKITEVALNLANGRIVHLVLSFGGVLGVGTTEIAIPSGAFTLDSINECLRLEVTEEKLKSAPVFDLTKWDQFYDSDRVAETHRHFGQEPDLVRMTEEEKSAGLVWDNVRRDSDGNRLHPLTSNALHHGRWGDIQKVSKLIGTTVKNRQEETIGKMDNLILKLYPGRVTAVIVSSGGFLGIGDELSAVPPIAFRFSPDHSHLILDTTKEALNAAPHFNSATWPEWKEGDYAREIYRAYHVETYYDANTAHDADNSARNKRDRNPSALTPLDQGSSTADVGATQNIRKEIMTREKFSLNAQNVKVITQNGKVTLRGPVNSQEEKTQIGEIAEKFAVAKKVDNLLEIKLPEIIK